MIPFPFRYLVEMAELPAARIIGVFPYEDRTADMKETTAEMCTLTALVRQYDSRLRPLAKGILRDNDAVDDVLQDAYAKAFTALPGFRGDAALDTWLYRITYNACLDELRRRGRRPVLVDCDGDGLPQTGGWDPSEAVVDRQVLADALARLPRDQRAVVWLVDAQGCEYAEAAQILGVAMGTVGSRLNRARAVLRSALRPALPESA